MSTLSHRPARLVTLVAALAVLGSYLPGSPAQAASARPGVRQPSTRTPASTRLSTRPLVRAGTVARPAASAVELPTLRTATSDTFDLGDGRLRTVVAAEPINFRNGAGAWTPIDNTLVAGSGGWTNRAGPYAVTLPAT